MTLDINKQAGTEKIIIRARRLYVEGYCREWIMIKASDADFGMDCFIAVGRDVTNLMIVEESSHLITVFGARRFVGPSAHAPCKDSVLYLFPTAIVGEITSAANMCEEGALWYYKDGELVASRVDSPYEPDIKIVLDKIMRIKKDWAFNADLCQVNE